MTKKYELVKEDSIEIDGHVLYRIRALKDIYNTENLIDRDNIVYKGDLGGYVENESNLSHNGSCWIFDNAIVYNHAKVIDHAHIHHHAKISNHAVASESCSVVDYAEVSNYAKISGGCQIGEYAKISNAQVKDCALVEGYAKVVNGATVSFFSIVDSHSLISGRMTTVGDFSHITGDAIIENSSDYGVFFDDVLFDNYITYTKSNDMLFVNNFHGKCDEFIKKAYDKNKKSGQKYESYVKSLKN